jgi:hypothetical protein
MDVFKGVVRLMKRDRARAVREAIVRYTAISAINLAILLAGIILGIMIAPRLEKSASAHGPQVSTPQAAPNGSTPAPAQQDQFEEVSPGMIVGTFGTDTLLAHRIAADQVMINGYDLLALQEGVLNLLKNKGMASYRDIDALVERAKVPKPLRLKIPSTVQPTPPTQKPEEKK